MSDYKIRDQKEAITQFIQHVENLESYGESGFDQEYSLVQEAQLNHNRDELSLMSAGKLEINLKKNRYKDIVPYDEHRVILETPEGEGSCDYINASWIQGELGTNRYIASQGPLPGTVNDFWKMVWQNQVEIIFMVCQLVEQNKIKCSPYWGDVGTSQEYGGLMVYTESEESIVNQCTLRKLRVSSGVEVHNVTQFQYWGWPDHGIPENPHDIQDIIEIMRTTRGCSHSPVVVHCSAGCGRTGAIITIDYVWTLLEEGKFGDNFSLFDLICDLRKQRMSLVQTPDQYALVNKVVKCLCEERLLKLTSHTYENVDFRQEVPVIGNGHKTPEDNDYEDIWSQPQSSGDQSPAQLTSHAVGNVIVQEEILLGSSLATAEQTLEEASLYVNAEEIDKKRHTTFASNLSCPAPDKQTKTIIQVNNKSSQASPTENPEFHSKSTTLSSTINGNSLSRENVPENLEQHISTKIKNLNFDTTTSNLLQTSSHNPQFPEHVTQTSEQISPTITSSREINSHPTEKPFSLPQDLITRL